MRLKYSYYYFEGALSDKACSDLLNLNKERQEALIENNVPPSSDVRKSKVGWSDDPLIYDMITPYIYQANRDAGWNFDVDWFESAQITEYKPGEHYNWHQDCSSEPYDRKENPNFHNKIRKISVTVSLSNGEDYTGGDLEFGINPNPRRNEWEILTEKRARTKGSIIVFPSHIWHRVTPVETGIRNSLVIWSLGYPFK